MNPKKLAHLALNLAKQAAELQAEVSNPYVGLDVTIGGIQQILDAIKRETELTR